ncbi:hypothetical protein BV25DRAFT_1546958 [Artomyces pyxidatus]|uniref:Uncharacterized protein n=1 Tax=Artomyces pyxidatus TaxID=48021 RepID=A0ACB8SJI6_9AGAM|nr:hypothetical protein BV25DRAFT_1546958 [Artomyces pyxidatus]
MSLPSLPATAPASAPIFLLPPEILARIFSTYAASEPDTFRVALRHFKEDWLEEGTPNSLHSARVGWINVTHVCHSWREVALGHAALWSSIDSTVSSPWREEMLRRSAQCPLSLHLHINSSNIEGLHHLIFDNLSRIQHLSLTWVVCEAWTIESEHRDFSGLAIALTNQSTTAPLLESLYLHSILALPALEVTTTSFPALRSLGVAGFGLSSTSSILENLAHIYIGQTSTTELYAILSRVLRLETISTRIMDNEDPPQLLSQPSTVSLPHLTSLNIDGFHERSLDLFSRLVIPVTAFVLVKFHNPEPRHFSHRIMNTFGGSSRPPRAILLEETFKIQLRFSAISSDWLESSERSHGTTVVQFLPNPWGAYGDGTLLGRRTVLWGGLCLDALTHLSLRLHFEKIWTKHRWLANFRRAQNVTTIHVDGVRAALSLLNALAEPVVRQDVLPPSIQSDTSLVPYVLRRSDLPDDLPDDLPSVPWGAAELDAQLFPRLEFVLVEHIDTLRIQLDQHCHTAPLSSDSAAIVRDLLDRLECRRVGGACLAKLVEIRSLQRDITRENKLKRRIRALAQSCFLQPFNSMCAVQ